MGMKKALAGMGALLLFTACKSNDKAGTKDLVVSQADGIRRIYFQENGLIKTATCSSRLAADPAQENIRSARSKCREQLSSGVKPEAFRAALLKYFKQAYRTEALSAYEEASLADTMAQIQDAAFLTTGNEARKQEASAAEIGSVWLRFLPFAAGALPSDVPPNAAPTNGTAFENLQVTVGSDQSEIEIRGQEWPADVNLISVFARTSDGQGICPAFIDVLSISKLIGGKPAPAFGGSVIGGSRFLLTEPLKSINGIRLGILPNTLSPLYSPTVQCQLTLTAIKIQPLELNYQIYIPDPIKLDARDQKMTDLVASPEARSWHFLWHGVRNGWPYFSPEEKKEIRDKLGAEWDLDTGGTGSRAASGEEFLHMHHNMVTALRVALGSDMYEAWVQPPAPNDPLFPVPGYSDPNLRPFYDAVYNDLSNMHRQAIDPARLKNMSLSQYGIWLEEGMHNLMHTTWAHPTQWYTSYSPTMQEILSNPGKYPEFSHPSNNSLAGTYTSHTNPTFYRLHGYIDNRIQTWLDANGYKTISDKCDPKDKACYQWKRSWDGKLPAKVVELLNSHKHDLDPKKIGELSAPVFREIAKASQMIPNVSKP